MFYLRIVAGFVLLIIAVHEIYRDLFQPSEQGSFSKMIGRAVFGTMKRIPALLPSSGPIAFFTVIGCWVLVILCGFALIYSALYPAAFHITVQSEKNTPHLFVTVLYLSLEILTTLGIGDIIPQAEPLRFVVGGEALIGVVLFSATISWFLLLYPALARLRTLARRATILCEASKQIGARSISGNSESLLSAFALDVVQVRVDFVHYPVIYYFHSGSKHASLPDALLLLSRFAEEGIKEQNHESVRLAAAGLNAGLADLAHLLGTMFVHADPNDPIAVFRAYAADHLSRGADPCQGEADSAAEEH